MHLIPIAIAVRPRRTFFLFFSFLFFLVFFSYCLLFFFSFLLFSSPPSSPSHSLIQNFNSSLFHHSSPLLFFSLLIPTPSKTVNTFNTFKMTSFNLGLSERSLVTLTVLFYMERFFLSCSPPCLSSRSFFTLCHGVGC